VFRLAPPWFVGRGPERGLLRERIVASAGGGGGLVLIAGDAGIGKTTLVAAARQDAADRGFRCAVGGSFDLTATPPFGPWREIATVLTGPGRPTWPSAVLGDPGRSETDVSEVFAGVARVLAAAAVETPLLVVLEDMHWADPVSIDLLRAVARQAIGLPILLVATYRPEEVDRSHPLYGRLPALLRETGAERIDLRPLTDGDLVELAVARYALPEADTGRLVAYLRDNAEGSPLYVSEVLRSLEEDGALRQSAAGWRLGPLPKLPVPTLLRQVIDGRVDRLGEAARQSLTFAAVIGEDIPLDLWIEAGEWSEEILGPIVERALAARVLDADADGSRVRFAHALIRKTLYEGSSPLQRRRWHRRIAEALSAGPATDPDEVAHHLQRAGDARAVEWLVRAGDRAARAHAWLTAADRFETAAGLLAPDPRRSGNRGWLLYRTARLLRYADPRRSLELLREAGRLATATDERLLAAHARYDGGMLHWFIGDLRAGLVDMAAGLAGFDALLSTAASGFTADWVADSVPAAERAPPQPDPIGGYPARSRRGTYALALAEAGRFDEAAAAAEASVAEATASGTPDASGLGALGDAWFGLGHVATAAMQPDQAARAMALARDAYRAIDHHVMLGATDWFELAEVRLAFAPADRRGLSRLAGAAAESLDRASGSWALGVSPQFPTLGLLLLHGEWDEAATIAEGGRAADHSGMRHEAARYLGRLARDRGDAAAAWAQVREVLPDGPGTDPGGAIFRHAVALQRVAADLAMDAGDLAAAQAWLDASDRWLAWSGSRLGQAEVRLGWARWRLLAGEPEAAGKHAAAALSLAADPRQPLVLLVAHRLLGEAATASGRFQEANHHLAAALDLATACAAPFEEALTQLAQAEAATAAGETARTPDLLSSVRVVSASLGAAPTVAKVDALAARLAARLGETRSADRVLPAGLSAREVAVLRLVAMGMTNPEVARELSISPRTVGHHLASVYAKLGETSRAGATRRAAELGLL
jgi:DNA-binding CsgD family transcriptional regulator